jgi:uncharacterized protein YgbK (DUF1537 family)
MSELYRSSPAVLVSPEAGVPLVRRSAVALHTCLVVSASARRAQLWVRAAHEEHWATVVCTTADDANRQAVRNRIDLALIDLQSASGESELLLRGLVRQLAARNGPLLAVCGKPNDTTGEVWSRQLGVWMYLPGVDHESDIALLCGEARNILKKLGDRAAHANR